MNAHELDASPAVSQEWTSQQKYQRMRRKDLIEVRLIAQAGVPERWHEARIVETNKGGAFAKLLTGHLERFFHWNDCRMPAKPEKQKPLATLGEVATGIIPSLQAPPPPQKPLPIFVAPPPPPPPAPAAAVQPPLVLFRRDPMPDNKSSRNPHPPTDGSGRIVPADGRARALPTRTSNDPRAVGSRVGTFISGERKSRGITQLGLADRATAKNRPRDGANVYNSRISQIELGKSLPTDDETLAIAEALGVSLEKMIELRDMDQSERAAEAAAARERREKENERREQEDREARQAARRASIAPPIAPRYEPPRTEAERQSAVYQTAPYQAPPPPAARPEPPPPYSPPPRVVAMQTDLASFVESVEALVAMPAEREARKSWFACAMELYRLSGGQP